MTHDKIICGDALNLARLIPKDTINLAIINPPHHKIDNKPSRHIDFVKEILKQTAKVTKIGGICCFVTSSDIHPDSETMDTTEMRAILNAQDDPEINSKWIFYDKIVWVKSPKETVKSLNLLTEIEAVSFDQTPFSTIDVLIRSDSQKDIANIPISERVQKLRISQAKKEEMLDPFWYIQPKSEKGFKDTLPRELLSRLLILFSKENNNVLDPFAGHGLTAAACKTLKRYYFCIENDQEKVKSAKNRVKSTKNIEEN